MVHEVPGGGATSLTRLVSPPIGGLVILILVLGAVLLLREVSDIAPAMWPILMPAMAVTD